MKTMSFKRTTVFIVLVTLICSCATVSKRKHRSGYYIDWKGVSKIVKNKDVPLKPKTSEVGFQKNQEEKSLIKKNKILPFVSKSNVHNIQQQDLYVVAQTKKRNSLNNRLKNKIPKQFNRFKNKSGTSDIMYSYSIPDEEEIDKGSNVLLKILGTIGILILAYALFVMVLGFSFILAFYQSLIWAAVVFIGGIIGVIALTAQLLILLWRKRKKDRNKDKKKSETNNLFLLVGSILTIFSMIILYIVHYYSFY